MNSPEITVLMPVYNAGRYLSDSLDSILAQSFRDFELLVIDDGSTDGSVEILANCRDPRLRVVRTPNRGVSSSLRLGVRLARAPYIARMDADDIACPDRLALQKQVLDRQGKVVVVHGRVDRIDDRGCVIQKGLGIMRDDIETKWALIWHNVLVHPTVMFRADALRANRLNYSRSKPVAQDFDLWGRIAGIGEFHMLPEVLIQYRVHEDKVSRPENAGLQLDVITGVIRDNLFRYGIEVKHDTAREIAVMTGCTHYDASAWPYREIQYSLSGIMDKLEQRFAERHDVSMRGLQVEQARLHAQWARTVAPENPGHGVRLLARAILDRPSTLANRSTWATLAGAVLPGGARQRLGKSHGLLSPAEYFSQCDSHHFIDS